MKPLTLTILISLLSPFAFSQSFGDYIKENAIETDSKTTLNPKLYDHFKDYSLIMVGEMHGTKEPSVLVRKLTELILTQEESISVGLELPEEELISYMEAPSDSALLSSPFFTKKNIDGRNGKAWFDLIRHCSNNSNINLFFFDNYQSVSMTNRDSSMYLSVQKQKLKFPESKIITLSGNIHSWLVPFRERPTMGNYCSNDSTTFKPGTICSINHTYSEGTMMNSKGDGLKLRTIPFSESIFSKSSELTNYILFYESKSSPQNNCIYYTRRVHHSELIER